MGLDRTLDLIGTEASGTSVHMAGSTVNDSLDALDVGLPCTVGTSVGVGNLNTEGHALAAKITLSHFIAPPIWNHSYCALHRRLTMITDFAPKCKHFF
jgi:hypothetical protein